MKKILPIKKLLCLLLALALILQLSSLVEAKDKAPLKVGIINMQRIFAESKQARHYTAAFRKELEGKKEILAAREKELRKLDDELKNPAARLTASAIREKSDKLARESQQLQRLRAGMEEELRKKDEELSRKIVADIKKIVISLSQSEGYTLILEKNATILSDIAMDITDKVIKLYDGNKK
ncbi:MAG TPA: OmpH family outer membrane protein [Smithellaceae bacterium]|nr:OmpH family outer membrane protein [Smithellaceae bacterium]